MASRAIVVSSVWIESRRSADSRWKTRFGRLILSYGVNRMARDLEVDPTSIYQWVRGYTSPRPERAVAIIALLLPLGRLRLEDIYQQRYARSLRSKARNARHTSHADQNAN